MENVEAIFADMRAELVRTRTACVVLASAVRSKRTKRGEPRFGQRTKPTATRAARPLPRPSPKNISFLFLQQRAIILPFRSVESLVFIFSTHTVSLSLFTLALNP